MILLTFDIIDSKKSKLKLVQVPGIRQFIQQIVIQFSLDSRNVQINDGDQLKILIDDSSDISKLILTVLSFLVENKILARVFISQGNLETDSYQLLTEADGPVFHLGRQLENSVKQDLQYYKVKSCSIRYIGQVHSELIDVLCLSFSKLCLAKDSTIPMLYKYLYENTTQTDLAKEYNISQVAVQKRLTVSNYSVAKRLLRQIEQLLKEDHE